MRRGKWLHRWQKGKSTLWPPDFCFWAASLHLFPYIVKIPSKHRKIELVEYFNGGLKNVIHK